MLQLLCIVFAIWPMHIVECATSQPSVCPPWLYYSLTKNKCVCGSSVRNIIKCNGNTSTVYIARYFCIFICDELNTTLVGSCPYGSRGIVPSQLKDVDRLCSRLHRNGQLCGGCNEGYSLSVYSHFIGCVKCEDYTYGWVKFITAAFLPLTVFYIIVILFRISATSSALNGYVFVSQTLANPTVLRTIYSQHLTNPCHHISNVHQQTFDLVVAVYAIWNLDFFRSFYKPICLSPDLKYQHVLLLDYAVAVYPLLLIFITFICVKLHDNFTIVVWLWMPFHKCLVRFRKQWNIQSYLVNALATFIVLSYVKILNVSFEFLIPSRVYNMKGQSVGKALWYYDGRVDMTSKEYLPYLALALSMLLIFSVFPLILLALYPLRCFQNLLRFCPCFKFKIALQIFMDAFHGCYKDTPHDYRHFAALYLAVRFINLLILSMCSSQEAYISTSLLVFVFTLTLVTKFQPYKSVRNNTIDVVMLLALISVRITSIIEHAMGLTFPNWMYVLMWIICAAIPPVYALYLLASQAFPTAAQCSKQGKKWVLKKMDEFKKTNAEDRPLLNHNPADFYSDYDGCHYSVRDTHEHTHKLNATNIHVI